MAPPLRAPFVATLNITNKCNLECHYCYSNSTPTISIPTATAIRIIGTLLEEQGVFYLMIAGGDPLLHPGICEIMSYSFAKYSRRVQLLTNGIRFCQDKFFAKFKDVCLDLSQRGVLAEIQVSLDSVVPDIHDVHRQHGRLVLNAIEHLLTLPVCLQLACVVTSANVKVADQIVDFYYPRVRSFHFMNLIFPNGVAFSQPGLSPATDHDLAALDARLQEKARRHKDLKVTSLVSTSHDPCLGVMEGRGCLAGITRIDVDANLDVKACCMANAVIGNLGRQTFEEMWHSAAAERIRACEYALCAPIVPNLGPTLRSTGPALRAAQAG